MLHARARQAAEQFNRIAERTKVPGRCDPTLSFETPELVQALALWQEKAAGREMPLRSDISARTLKPFLPNLIVVDIVADSQTRRYRARLMGTAISYVFGDHTGKFIDEAVAPPFRERWSAALDAAVVAGRPLRFAGRVEYAGQDYLSAELLLAPFGAPDRTAEAVLAVGYFKSVALHIAGPAVRNAITKLSRSA